MTLIRRDATSGRILKKGRDGRKTRNPRFPVRSSIASSLAEGKQNFRQETLGRKKIPKARYFLRAEGLWFESFLGGPP